MNNSKWEIPKGWNPINKRWVGDDTTFINLLYPNGTIHYEQFSYEGFLKTCDSKYDDGVRDAIAWQYASHLEMKDRFYIIPSDDQWFPEYDSELPERVDIIDRETGCPVEILNGLWCSDLSYISAQKLAFELNLLERKRVEREKEDM